MYLERVFSRKVTAGVAWAQDALPADGAGNPIGPYMNASAIPAGYAGANDYTLNVKRRDDSGFPPTRIVVSYSAPAGAPQVSAALYLFDRNTGQWYLTPDSPKMLSNGTLTYFGSVVLAEPAQTYSAQQGSPIPGASDYVLIVAPPAGPSFVNGTYQFGMAPSHGRGSP